VGRPSLGGSSATSPPASNQHFSHGSAIRLKKQKSSTDSLRKVFSYGHSPSLLNGSGDAVSISAGPGQRGSGGVTSSNSPGHSRSSSAQGSYSTSATTFEDIDEMPRRGREDSSGQASGSERKSEANESKGNVIVSVRVRPDAKHGKDGTRSEGEWMVDGRKSLIAYRGREGGDYYYGQSNLNDEYTSPPNLPYRQCFRTS